MTQVALDVVCREVCRVRSPGRTPRWPGRARFPNSRRHFLTKRAVLPSCSNDAGRTVSSALAAANAARWCLDCGRQTSITAGTAMHRSKLPLTAWFWAAHLVATHSNGDNPRKRAETLRRAPRRSKTATGMRHADAPPRTGRQTRSTHQTNRHSHYI